MITQEEKIDYIYETLKRRERNEKFWLFFKWGFRIFILGYLYYFFTTGLPVLMQNYIPSFLSFWNRANSQETKEYSPGELESMGKILEKALKNNTSY